DGVASVAPSGIDPPPSGPAFPASTGFEVVESSQLHDAAALAMMPIQSQRVFLETGHMARHLLHPDATVNYGRRALLLARRERGRQHERRPAPRRRHVLLTSDMYCSLATRALDVTLVLRRRHLTPQEKAPERAL